MPQVILIKHARPQVDECLPSDQWRLSDEGREASVRLGEQLRDRGIARVVSSTEPKAFETAQIIARGLGVGVESAPGLHEHDRSNVPVMPTRQFISMIALFFNQRRRLVLGKETAHQAHERFEKAVAAALQAAPDQPAAIVAHGTVLALYAAARCDRDPFELWRSMQLPSYFVVDLDRHAVIDVVERV
jgi:broad specificity phosphatase PhoE